MSAFEDVQSIEFPDPDAAREWTDENADLTPAQRRRVESWIKEWDSSLGQEHVARLDQHSEAITKEFNSLIESLDNDLREAAEIPVLLRKGRLTSKEATKRLAELARNRESYRKILESVQNHVERWESSADAEPTEHLRLMQERFKTGVPRYGTRSLTAAILRGEQR
jgi:succinate dehydrogenase flavin-adding protein (antitoxin of CptAB toxin-antitoxin module)